MSIGLRLLARLDRAAGDPDTLLDQTSSWICQNYPELKPRLRRELVEAKPTLFCQFHPAAEEMELSLVDGQYLTASANTSTVGPGYHIFVCDLLHSWARDFHASWIDNGEGSEDYADEAEYFFTDDRQWVFDYITSWLQTLAGTFFDGTLGEGKGPIQLCMGIDVQFETDQLAITPLGPRDRDWLFRTSQSGISGRDFFAWWEPGLNGEYYLGRAMVQMWSSVRWRRPVNDSEWALLQEIADGLIKAYRLDPELEYPWAEWAEILGHLGAPEEDQDWVRSRVGRNSTIGYRRRSVRVSLPGGWKIRLPGSFSDFESGENDASYAVDPPRKVWFTAYRSSSAASDDDFKRIRGDVLESRPDFVQESPSYIGGCKTEEKVDKSGNKFFVLNSSNRCPSRRCVLTIVYTDPKDRELGLGIWRSMRPPGSDVES